MDHVWSALQGSDGYGNWGGVLRGLIIFTMVGRGTLGLRERAKCLQSIEKFGGRSHVHLGSERSLEGGVAQ